MIETIKSVIYSLFIFCIVGPFIGATIFSGASGEFPLGILFFAYLMGLMPAVAACAVNWVLFLSLKGRLAIPDYLIGTASGLILLAVLIILKGFPSHLSNGVILILVFVVPSAVCSSIVNSYLSKKTPS